MAAVEAFGDDAARRRDPRRRARAAGRDPPPARRTTRAGPATAWWAGSTTCPRRSRPPTWWSRGRAARCSSSPPSGGRRSWCRTPTPPRDHQAKNAQWLAEAGAAVVLPDADCTGERLRGLVGRAAGRPPPPGGDGRVRARGGAPRRRRPRGRRGAWRSRAADRRAAPVAAARAPWRRGVSGPRPIHMVGIGGAGMSGLALLARAAGYAVGGTDREESATLARPAGRRGRRARRPRGRRRSPADAAALVVVDGHRRRQPRARRGAAARPAGAAPLGAAGRADGRPARPGRRRRPRQVHHQRDAARRPRRRVGLRRGDDRGRRAAPARCGATGPGSWPRPTRATARCSTCAPEGAILLNVDHDHHATYATLEEVRGGVPRVRRARCPPTACWWWAPTPRPAPAPRPRRAPVRLVGDVPGAFCRVERTAGRPRVHAGAGRRPPGARAAGGGRAPQRRERRLRPGAGRLVRRAAPRRPRRGWPASPASGGAWSRAARRAGVEVVDDYAHHPAEIRATLAAARERGAGRVVVVFQPHLPSRTRALGPELAEALGAADVVDRHRRLPRPRAGRPGGDRARRWPTRVPAPGAGHLRPHARRRGRRGRRARPAPATSC